MTRSMTGQTTQTDSAAGSHTATSSTSTSTGTGTGTGTTRRRLPPLPATVPWFVVLPNSAAGGAVAARLRSSAGAPPRMIRYPSGRPWLVGWWPAHSIVSAFVRDGRVALVGCAPIDTDRLARVLAHCADVAALDVLATDLPGSFHLVAEIGGQHRVQGSASGMRRVFHATVDGAVIASDRADLVAALAECPRDLTALALSLIDPVAPHPLADRPLWRGVTAVEPDRWLRLDVGGRPSQPRWWTAPEPVLDRRGGATLVRRALTDAVDARTAGGATVSADLSGGLDSTSLCFLAAAGPATLIPYTGVGLDPADDDAAWAAMARADLPGTAHEILPRERVPLVYDGLAAPQVPLDRPFIGIIDRAKLMAGLDLVASYRPRVHLCGLGGDEVAQGTPNYLPALARAHPLLALAELRGFRAQTRWPLTASLWTLRPRSYRSWLADCSWLADQSERARTPGAPEASGGRAAPGGSGVAEAPGPDGWRAPGAGPLFRRWRPGDVSELDWMVPPRLPPWLTAEAIELIRAAVAAELPTATPLGRTRDRHGELFAVRVGAAVARGFAQLAAPIGFPLAAPFFDDRVVEACLAVAPAERTTPWEYKPLLKEAMRGVVPDRCLRRTTKAEGSAEEEAGLRANQATLRALAAESRLARLGLVDADALGRACPYSTAPDRPYEALQQTFAAEAWLRGADGPTGPSADTPGDTDQEPDPTPASRPASTARSTGRRPGRRRSASDRPGPSPDLTEQTC
jgi:asparagine synthase (glutamine-hydrolysing)